MNSSTLIDNLASRSVRYFLELAHPATGLVPDTSRPGAPCSIAATGFGLAALVIAAERGWISRKESAERILRTLRTFARSSEDGRGAAGQRGFFYHFLDLETGRRARRSEVSTIDTTFLLVGALVAGAYFDGQDPVDREIRTLAEVLYRRADWQWALAGGRALSHGWRPERGFLRARWQGYNEGLLAYLLALGSPTCPIPATSYGAWTETYRWRRVAELEFLYSGPLFTHQFAQAWIDFRGVADAAMVARRTDYFENSRRATLVHQRYAMRNPRNFAHYGEHMWGLSACTGPGPALRSVSGKLRRFWDYRARGAPWGPDDGTLAPCAVTASLPFAPELVIRTLGEMHDRVPTLLGEYGHLNGFNPSFPPGGWISRDHLGIDQGSVVLMLENARSGLVWKLAGRCPHIVRGLRRAGFAGGWLESVRGLAEADDVDTPLG